MRIIVLSLCVAFAAAQSNDLPVEQTKKNIKVLQGLPSSQLIPVMAFMSNSLGVTCAHCHAKAWESDEKPAKETARKMMAMTRAINEQQFGGKLTVTCNTCHQGRVKPVATPDVANAGWNTRPAAQAKTSVAAEDAINRFPKTPAEVTRRVVHGMVERYNGRDEPVSDSFTLTIDGSKISYETKLSHPPEASRALAIYLLAPPAIEKLRGERWFVDGDITARTRETPTPFGNLPDQIDYSDYRNQNGARLPFRAQWSRADYRVTFTVKDIE
ncbi:MAG TPA: c-type cytochrome [Thermoanaerobaculia bacterium]